MKRQRLEAVRAIYRMISVSKARKELLLAGGVLEEDIKMNFADAVLEMLRRERYEKGLN